MKLGLLCVEMVIIVFLGNIEADFPDDLPSSCPRDKSRLVRTIIDKKILPIFDRYRIEMPIECPFHPHRDLLWWPEDNLSAYIFNGVSDHNDNSDNRFPPSSFSIISITETLASFFTSIWRCPLCFKLFDCSERLAHHWDYDHRLYRHRTENFVCLSDYCDFIRCDILTRRRIYPTIGTSKYLARMISSTLAINPGDLPSPPPSPPSPILGPKNCNQTEMVSLEKRCRITVRQCLLPLLISKITLKDFHDIEDDLVKEACGYLNCEKFFDLTIHEEPPRPLSFCLLMGIIMIGGFLICYYIVWYLLESTIGLKRARLEEIRRSRQMKGNRSIVSPLDSPNSSPSPPPLSTTTNNKITPVPGSGSQTKTRLRQSNQGQITAANAAAAWRHYRYMASSSRRSVESETSQEDASPASSESRYIVTHSTNSRRYQRPGHLHLASELALLLEKRSMETVPESSDDQVTPVEVSCLSKMSSNASPPVPPSPPQSSYRKRPSSAGAIIRSGLTRSNVAIASQQNNDETSQDSRQDSSRSTVQDGHSMVSPIPSIQDHIPTYYPNRRRDFALKGRRRSRYEGDDDTFDDEDTDELITATTITPVDSNQMRSQIVEPMTIIKNKPAHGSLMSDNSARSYNYHYNQHRGYNNQDDGNSKPPNEYRSNRGVLFSTRNHDTKKCEFNFDDDDRRSTDQKSSSRSTSNSNPPPPPQSQPRPQPQPLPSTSTSTSTITTTRIKGRSERGGFKFERDSSASASDTVTGLEIESEPLVSVTSGRRFCRPGIVRSISSVGAMRRAAMTSQRSKESSTTSPPQSTIPSTSGIINQSRYRLTKSQSMDNPCYQINKQSTRSTNR